VTEEVVEEFKVEEFKHGNLLTALFGCDRFEVEGGF
jgi:hypothetical protein